MSATVIKAKEILLSRHRLTVNDFHKMGEAGILDEDARVELIDGDLVDMAPIGSLHAGTLEKLRRWLERSVKEDALVFSQNPIVLGEYSEPQPDVVLLKPREDFYTRSHPGPGDVLLLIEVTDSSAHYDRSVKIPLYARFDLPEVWLIDLPLRRLEVYRTPRPEYADYERIEHHHDGTISPEKLPGVVVSVADLFVV